MKDAMASQDKPSAEQQETGKFRASRIPLDYYKHPDRLDRWRRRLLGLAVVLSVGWCGLTLLRGDSGRLSFSRGPVAAVHATWEDRCQTCHVSATSPISSETRWLPEWLTDRTQTPDHQCQTCHSGAVHHANQKAKETPSCAGCHRDHRGREALLARVPDQACTGCHQNLTDHIDPARPKDFPTLTFGNVTRFDEDHPEFRAVRREGKLKFSHKVHMTAGMDCGFTLEKIAAYNPDNKNRYEDMRSRDGTIQLDCSSCHQLDSSGFSQVRPGNLGRLQSDLVFPRRQSGGYMLPITYENQCAACHPLAFAKDPEKDGANASVPHRLQPQAVRQYLQDFYTRQYLNGNNALLERDFQRPRIPPGRQPDSETKKAKDAITQKVEVTSRILLDKASKNACSECHHYQGDPLKDEDSRVEPPRVNGIWFQHASFNHATHRAVACTECHAQESTKSETMLIPAKELCATCHSPPSRTAAGLRGGARSDCVECHHYHNGKDPSHGIGAAARGAREQLDIQQFLHGGQP
jgi:hypothetical protein